MLAASSALGQSDSGAQHGFWAGVDAGYAQLKRTYTVTPSTSESKPSLRFRAGYSPNPRLLLGVELGGWNLQGSTDATKGEGIETIFAVARYYPLERTLLFVEGGLGAVKYWNNRPLEQGANGSGAFLGVGHDFHLTGHFFLAPSIDYSWGHFNGAVSPPGVTQDERYRAVTLRLGVTYRLEGS
jgi:hypothetical protein